MRIMFCLGSMNNGGAERVVSNLSNELSKKHDVSITITSSDKSAYELNKNIKLFHLDESKLKESVIKRTIKRIKKLRKIIKDEQADVIVSLLPEPSFRVLIAKTFLNQKVIVSVRNDPNVEYNNFFKKFMVKILYTKADGFIFQTEDAKKWFSKKIQKKSVIIPNPINEKFICKPYIGERKKEIVTVGRLTKQKNQKLLIRAFTLISKKHPNYILKIYGDGNLKDELHSYISDLCLEDRIILMGKTDNVKEEIFKSGIFVLSSDYEGMPNALMEAMALGIPCISTDCPIGGSKFLIKNNENGILVPVNNAEKLADAMNKIIENRDFSRKLSFNANKICESLNPKIINKKWEDFIYKVIRGELDGKN